MKRLAPACLVLVLGAGACDDSGAPKPSDAGPGDAPAADVPAEGPRADGGDVPSDSAGDTTPDAGTPFALLVTESPPGPQNNDRASWGGVLQYTVPGSGGALQPATGIPAAMLADPAGLAWRASSSEVFVANRHGNNAADGTAGSITRFGYDRITRTFTLKGTITGNGLSGVHGMTFHPMTGELFATNYVGCVSRFTFDATGTAMPNGTLGSGSCRGVRVSADGKYLYVTTAGTVIKQFDLTNGMELASASVAENPSLHGLGWHGGKLHAAGLTNNKVHRFLINLAGSPVQLDTIAASSPAALAFSPDDLEMFTAGHRDSDIIERFRYDRPTDKWTTSAEVRAQKSLGDILVLP